MEFSTQYAVCSMQNSAHRLRKIGLRSQLEVQRKCVAAHCVLCTAYCVLLRKTHDLSHFYHGLLCLGAGFFGGGFTNEGPNESGNKVDGRLSSGGFIAEYLALQKNFEVALGGMAGGGVITVEEHISSTGDVELLRRRRTSYFAAYPWVRLGYNPAPFVNVGLDLGYYFGTNDVGGFAASLDIVVGLIP